MCVMSLIAIINAITSSYFAYLFHREIIPHFKDVGQGEDAYKSYLVFVLPIYNAVWAVIAVWALYRSSTRLKYPCHYNFVLMMSITLFLCTAVSAKAT
jgi:hypothetical protein